MARADSRGPGKRNSAFLEYHAALRSLFRDVALQHHRRRKRYGIPVSRGVVRGRAGYGRCCLRLLYNHLRVDGMAREVVVTGIAGRKDQGSLRKRRRFDSDNSGVEVIE